jgi:hypothetical protein
MKQASKPISSRGNRRISVIHIAGFEEPLIIENGRSIANWTQSLRTKLCVKTKGIMIQAIERFASNNNISEWVEENKQVFAQEQQRGVQHQTEDRDEFTESLFFLSDADSCDDFRNPDE